MKALGVYRRWMAGMIYAMTASCPMLPLIRMLEVSYEATCWICLVDHIVWLVSSSRPCSAYRIDILYFIPCC